MSKLINARVHVMLKDSILDAQGRAVLRSLGTLGFNNVKNVRIGKVIDLELEDSDAKSAIKQVTEMCDKLLANAIIEQYKVEIS